MDLLRDPIPAIILQHVCKSPLLPVPLLNYTHWGTATLCVLCTEAVDSMKIHFP